MQVAADAAKAQARQRRQRRRNPYSMMGGWSFTTHWYARQQKAQSKWLRLDANAFNTVLEVRKKNRVYRTIRLRRAAGNPTFLRFTHETGRWYCTQRSALRESLHDSRIRLEPNSDLRGWQTGILKITCDGTCAGTRLIGVEGVLQGACLQSNLNGDASDNDFLRGLPAVEVFSYQCSPLSTSAGIESAFETARRCVVLLACCVPVPHASSWQLQAGGTQHCCCCVAGRSGLGRAVPALTPEGKNCAPHVVRTAQRPPRRSFTRFWTRVASARVLSVSATGRSIPRR